MVIKMNFKLIYEAIQKKGSEKIKIRDSFLFMIIIQGLTLVLFYNKVRGLVIILFLFFFYILRVVINKLKVQKRKYIVIKDGKINFNSMIRSPYSLDDLVKELETRNIDKIEDIKLAYINNNKLIIDTLNPSLDLIYNGNINYQTLSKLGKKVSWLTSILERRNLRLTNIYYSFYLDEQVFIVLKP